MKAFEGYKIKNIELRNRVVMPPMCMYSSDANGYVQDFHRMHYGARSIGGAGLVIQEATAVETRGRISEGDLGIWTDKHIEDLSKLVRIVKGYGAVSGIQLAHAGRKCTIIKEDIVAPSPVAYDENYATPREMAVEDIKKVVNAFKLAAGRALKSGYDLIEIHGAHGYLIHEFLSPLTNHRTDEYGGNTENRARLLSEVIDAVKEIWPSDKPLTLRVSAADYSAGGIDVEMMCKIVDLVKDRLDMIHVSSGGLVPAEMQLYPGYQVKFSERIKEKCKVPTIAVGLIEDVDMVEHLLMGEKADLVALGRELLRNPNWVLNNMHKKGITHKYPDQYFRAYK
jgi:NADPH2 dehydrogenase